MKLNRMVDKIEDHYLVRNWWGIKFGDLSFPTQDCQIYCM